MGGDDEVETTVAGRHVHSDCLVGCVPKRKTSVGIMACFKRLRASYPTQLCIYIVLDNLSAKVCAAKAFFPGQNMESVYAPTGASWLNAIESEFTSLSTYPIKNSDDKDRHNRGRRIYRYLRLRNRQHVSTNCYLAQFMR